MGRVAVQVISRARLNWSRGSRKGGRGWISPLTSPNRRSGCVSKEDPSTWSRRRLPAGLIRSGEDRAGGGNERHRKRKSRYASGALEDRSGEKREGSGSGYGTDPEKGPHRSWGRAHWGRRQRSRISDEGAAVGKSGWVWESAYGTEAGHGRLSVRHHPRAVPGWDEGAGALGG